jgi:hypothetical protein
MYEKIGHVLNEGPADFGASSMYSPAMRRPWRAGGARRPLLRAWGMFVKKAIQQIKGEEGERMCAARVGSD